jgi:hypothetical protein
MQVQSTSERPFDFDISAPSETVGERLLVDLRAAFESLIQCLDELDELLEEPLPNLVQLTILRLKLSQLRLTRGSLVTTIREFLEGRVTDSEQLILDELKAAHQRLLQKAVTHTTHWGLEAVEAKWSEYRQTTRLLANQWRAKASEEQDLLFPLIERHTIR